MRFTSPPVTKLNHIYSWVQLIRWQSTVCCLFPLLWRLHCHTKRW